MSVVPAASGPKTNVFGEPIPDGPLLNPGQQKVCRAPNPSPLVLSKASGVLTSIYRYSSPLVMPCSLLLRAKKLRMPSL